MVTLVLRFNLLWSHCFHQSFTTQILNSNIISSETIFCNAYLPACLPAPGSQNRLRNNSFGPSICTPRLIAGKYFLEAATLEKVKREVVAGRLQRQVVQPVQAPVRRIASQNIFSTATALNCLIYQDKQLT